MHGYKDNFDSLTTGFEKDGTPLSQSQKKVYLNELKARTTVVWLGIAELLKRDIVWASFDNSAIKDTEAKRLYFDKMYLSGEFDHVKYKDWITIKGQYTDWDVQYKICENGFPTKFLWMQDSDWKNEILNNLPVNERSDIKKYLSEMKKSNSQSRYNKDLGVI